MNSRVSGILVLILLALGSAFAGCGRKSGTPEAANTSNSLIGAGATFPAPLYSKWFSEYEKQTGLKVNYQPIGSGGGIKAIIDRTVDFGASDAPMTDEQLKAAGGDVLHIPTALGCVVITYNLDSFQGQLRFSPTTIAGIFLGEIVRWNDAVIAADNPGLSLPDSDIVVIHRSDGSGTTNIFTEWLTKVSDNWKAKVGKGTSVNWPAGLGGNGNPGVAGEVQNNPHSIGYVELIYAVQNKLPYAWIKNKSGKFVEPTLASTTAAAASVSSTVAADLRFSLTDPDGPDAYPISGATWLLVHTQLTDATKAQALARMLWWATHEAQRFNGGLSYATIPAALVPQIEKKIKSINVNGNPAFNAQ